MKSFDNLIARNATFRQFLSASTISLLGNNIFDLAVPLYVLEKTHSAIALSFANVALHLPYFLMAPMTGYIVDQFDKRKVMIAADVGQVLSIILFILYDVTGLTKIYPILALVFIAKSLMILFDTVATFQLIPALVAESDLPEANTWFLSSQRLIQIVGPLVGGLVLMIFGIRTCALLNMLSFSATLYFVFNMRGLNDRISSRFQNRTFSDLFSVVGMFKNFTESLAYIWRSSLFRAFIMMMFLWNLSSLTPNTPSLMYYFTAQKGFTSATYGMVASLIGFGGILGYFIAGICYRRFRFYNAFVGSCLWQAIIASLSLAFFHYPMALAIIFSVSRIGSSVLSMGTFMLRQTEIPKSHMGGINSCLRMFFMSAAPLSAIVQGLIIHHLGVGTSFVLGAVFLWCALWLAKKTAIEYVTQRETRQAA